MGKQKVEYYKGDFDLLTEIKGWDKYLISECGNIIVNSYNDRKLIISNQIINGKLTGYKYVALIDENKKVHRIAVHRLVAMTFIDNVDNLPEIDHIDKNRSNNHVSNLRWRSIKDNRDDREWS